MFIPNPKRQYLNMARHIKEVFVNYIHPMEPMLNAQEARAVDKALQEQDLEQAELCILFECYQHAFKANINAHNWIPSVAKDAI